MIDFQDIPNLIQPYIDAVKMAKDEVEYTELYFKSVESAEAIEVHSKGEFPAELINKRAPSESWEEFEYRKESYQPVTKAPWARLVNATGSVFHNVTLETDSEDATFYLYDDYPTYSSLLGWFSEVARPIKCEQPNAVVVTTLMELPQTDTDLPEPVALIYETPDVIIYDERRYFVGVYSRTIPVKVGRSTEYSGLEFAIFDEVWEYRYTQVGKKTDYTFELSEYYQHNLGRVPAYQLKGIPTYVEKSILWVSPFDNAIPYLNKAAVESSTLDAVIQRTGFPTRVYYEEDCDAYGCESGYITDVDSGLKDKCPSCKGTGKKGGFNAFRDYTHTQKTGGLPGDQPTFPGLAYVSPDSTPLEFLDRRINNLIEKAGHSVSFDIARDSSQPETATKHNLDREEQYKTLSIFAGQIYDIIEYVTEDILKIRYIRENITYSLARQSDFSIRSSEELLGELKQARESGMPSFVVQEILASQVQLRSSADERMDALLQLAEFADPLHGTTNSDALLQIGRGVQNWQGTLHFQFGNLVRQAMSDNENFLELPLSEQAKELERRAKAIQGTQGAADSIFAGITG